MLRSSEPLYSQAPIQRTTSFKALERTLQLKKTNSIGNVNRTLRDVDSNVGKGARDHHKG